MNINSNQSRFGALKDLGSAIMFKPESKEDKEARAKWIKADTKDVFQKK
jgi:hypothetical protein